MFEGDSLNIWIIKEGEFTNLLSGKARASRAAMLADYFIEGGHHVIAWSSLWNHDLKKFIKENRKVIELKPGLTLRILNAKKEYKKNVSLARIAQGREIGRLFRDEAKKMPKPDLIYSCWPLIETSYEAVKYGQENGIPVVVDIRDQWPDIFIQPFPDAIQPIAKFGINLIYKKRVCYAMQNATMVTATIPKSMDLPNEYGRNSNELDHYVFHCYKKPNFSSSEMEVSLQEWSNKFGVGDSTLNVILICSVRKRVVDFDMVIETAKKLEGKPIKFIICGTGQDFDEVSSKASKCDNVVMAGLCNQLQLFSLASVSQIGLLPYHDLFDFRDSLPTKFSEYLASSLAIFTSLNGLSRTVVEKNDCGAYFQNATELSDLLKVYLDDKSLLERQRSNAEALYQQSFNADIVYRSFVNELISLIEKQA